MYSYMPVGSPSASGAHPIDRSITRTSESGSR